MIAAGHYFLPGSAHYRDARLDAATPQTLRVTAASGEILAEASRRQVKATARLGRLVRKLDFPDGGRFETADNDAVDALLHGGGLLHRLEASWRMALIAVAAAGAMTAWFALYGAPLLARNLAAETPPSVSRFMTEQTLAALDGRTLQPTTLAAPARLRMRQLFETVAAREPHPGAYRLLLRSAPLIGPNAFAFPDGSIVLTDQLAGMIRSDTEIEGVFAHEMSHVNHAHALQRVYQASLVPAAVAFITGDATQIGHFATVLPGVLLQQSYSRSFEQQADDDAARMLRGMGKDPGALADLLERMSAKLCGGGDCGPGWLGSHPATAERAARLRHGG